MKSLIQLLSFLGVLVFFTSCYPSQVATTSGAMVEPDVLYTNSWDLAELNGVAVTRNDQPGYIKFTPTTNRITGYTGCNYIGGSIALADRNGITFSPVATTKHNCTGNTLDASLLPTLRNVDRYGMVNNQLVMYRDNRIIARWSPADYTHQDLYGNWQLAYISDDEMPFDVLYPVDKRPALVIDANKNIVSGTTGFNTYNCPVKISKNGIAFTDCTSTNMACEGPGEAKFMKSLKRINNYTFTDDNTLVLYTDDNQVLRFTRMNQ